LTLVNDCGLDLACGEDICTSVMKMLIELSTCASSIYFFIDSVGVSPGISPILWLALFYYTSDLLAATLYDLIE